MTQKEILKGLGYALSIEDGAVWEHKDFIWEDRFIWRGTPFYEILRDHNEKVERASITCAAKRVNEVQIFTS